MEAQTHTHTHTFIESHTNLTQRELKREFTRELKCPYAKRTQVFDWEFVCGARKEVTNIYRVWGCVIHVENRIHYPREILLLYLLFDVSRIECETRVECVLSLSCMPVTQAKNAGLFFVEFIHKPSLIIVAVCPTTLSSSFCDAKSIIWWHRRKKHPRKTESIIQRQSLEFQSSQMASRL